MTSEMARLPSARALAAGLLAMPYRRFLVADVAAAVLWAVYASMLGYVGGQAFAGDVWRPLAVSLGLAALVALGFEAWRRVQQRRGKDLLGDDLAEEARRR